MRNKPMRASAAGWGIAVLAALSAAGAAGCAGSGPASAAVPSLSQTASASAGLAGRHNTGSGPARASALHAAAQCVRQHGIPGYSDPILTPSGAVYSDTRSLEDVPESVVLAMHQACRTLLAEAGLDPESEPPAPPELVQAGVRAAECERKHGMPNVTDPTARSPYTPGHGFGMTAAEMPPGGKASPVWQAARNACNAQITAMIEASTLGSLSNDGQ
jgi:hypothetical protein